MVAGRKIEVEMKYELRTPEAGDRYLVAPELGRFHPAGPVRMAQIEDRYVDSADWALSRAGWAARFRRTGRETTIGLKRQASPEGRLQRREELEGPAEAGSLAIEWPASPARSVILELCGDAPLVELLVIRQKRRYRRFETGETTADLSIDEVEVLADERSLNHFVELEMELDAGPAEPLAELEDIFDADRALRPSTRSKLERAVRAVRKAMPDLAGETQRRWLEAPPIAFRRRHGHSGPDREPKSSSEPGADSDTAVEIVPVADGQAAERAEAGAALPGGPRALGVMPDDSLPEAARKVLKFHFAKMRNKERGTREGTDMEDLHAMRVATRRMRAAWRVFDDAFKPSKTKKLRRSLRTLSDRLGAVRDLDVLFEGVEAYRLGLEPEQRPGLEPLVALWRRQQSLARDLLLAELDSHRYAGFIDDMKDFLDAGANEAANVASPTLPHRVRDRVPSQIWAAYEAVRAFELVLPWADVETLHQLRIATKWLRYDLEFFGETLGRDSAHLLDRVVALQDFLGCLHDADVAAKLSRDILVARSGELSKAETEAIGAYLHSRERELARRRRSLGPVWRAVAGAPFRRGLGRATAAL
jgi:CHAD domain-containing protein